MTQQLKNTNECPFLNKINGHECPLGKIPPAGFFLPMAEDNPNSMVHGEAYKEYYCKSAHVSGMAQISCNSKYEEIKNSNPSVSTKLPQKNKRVWHYCPYILSALDDDKVEIEDKAGCYVATCVYGSYDCPEVLTLRCFRDNTLDKSWYGKVFIRVYYAISPCVVKQFGAKKWFNKLWRPVLDKIVTKIQKGDLR